MNIFNLTFGRVQLPLRKGVGTGKVAAVFPVHGHGVHHDHFDSGLRIVIVVNYIVYGAVLIHKLLLRIFAEGAGASAGHGNAG